MAESATQQNIIVSIPASRSAALTRGVLWLAASIVCVVFGVVVFRSFDFFQEGLSRRLVDISIVVVTLPIVGAGVYLAVLGMRWVLFAVWPRFVGVQASRGELRLCFATFGTKCFDVKRLDLKYPFELSGDEEGFESFLPEEQQLEELMPRMSHPEFSGRIDALLLRHLGATEPVVAGGLRPAFDRWRSDRKAAQRHDQAGSDSSEFA